VAVPKHPAGGEKLEVKGPSDEAICTAFDARLRKRRGVVEEEDQTQGLRPYTSCLNLIMRGCLVRGSPLGGKVVHFGVTEIRRRRPRLYHMGAEGAPTITNNCVAGISILSNSDTDGGALATTVSEAATFMTTA
jgi:hypothetical protein